MTSAELKTEVNLNHRGLMKLQKVRKRSSKKNSLKMSLEGDGVRHLLYMIWRSIPRRGSCIGEAAFTKFDACPRSLIFAGAGGAKTGT